MKMNRLTSINWMCFVVLALSCAEHPQEKTVRQKIAEWKPAYLSFNSEMSEDDRLSFCFQHKGTLVSPIERVFPEHYGGSHRYLSDRTKTVICLTDTSEHVKQWIVDLCQLTRENYIFEKCEYSWNELLRIMRQLTNIHDVFTEWDIIDISISTLRNKVIVYFNGARDEEKLSRFQSEVIDHDAVIFAFAQEKGPAIPY